MPNLALTARLYSIWDSLEGVKVRQISKAAESLKSQAILIIFAPMKKDKDRTNSND
jgi:hypothetical protein